VISYILFLGLNPGGGLVDAEQGELIGERKSWPLEHEYEKQDYILAKRIRKIWENNKIQNSVALNQLFFRSPGIGAWKQNTLPVDSRKNAEKFCLNNCEKMIRAINPKEVIMIGLSTLSRSVFIEHELKLGERRRRLVVKGNLWGFPAYSVIHLSGSWGVKESEIMPIREFFETASS
jgi:hypothetical protein